MTCTATHENGTTWRFAVAVNAKRGNDHVRYQHANAARNYCQKNRIPGRVTIIDEGSGDTYIAVVGWDYTLKIEG